MTAKSSIAKSYSDSIQNSPNVDENAIENWQSIGALAAKCADAIAAGQFEAAEAYHLKMVEAAFADMGRGDE